MAGRTWVVTDEDECVRVLRGAAEVLGESPTKAQYESLGLRPSSATIIRRFGSWNEAKEQAGLDRYPSRGPRVGPKPDDVELPVGASWTELSVDQRWHYRNVDWNAERTSKRRAELRAWINDYKRARGCKRCGLDDPSCLDLHHVDQDEKEMAVGTMVTYGYGKEKLRSELSKCEVLCANCHRKEHYEPPTSPGFHSRRGHGRKLIHRYKRASNGCTRCGETDPDCLEFHHVTGEKQSTVARLVSDGRPMEDVRAEIEKCVLVCVNCHRREHYRVPSPDE